MEKNLGDIMENFSNIKMLTMPYNGKSRKESDA